MNNRAAVAILTTIWLLSTLLWLRPGIMRPDGAGYYVYLPSAVIGHDLLFFDEWQRLGLVPGGRILHKEITATDHLGDHWTCGSAVWWLPSFAAGDALRAIPPQRRFPRDGISLPYNAAVITSSAVAGLGVLLIGWWMSRSLAAAIGIWFGSPLLWYALQNSILSHVVSAFACALLLLAAMRLRRTIDGAALFAAGLAAGFAGAVRPQNLVFAVLPLFFVERSAIPMLIRKCWAFAAGLLLGLLPELIVSFFLYGNPIAFLWGGAAKPFAAFERIWIWEPIFSWYHGLVPWTPFLGFGIVGFFFLLRDDRRLGLAAIYAFASQWAINAAFERSFWGAYAFGQRRFENCAVFFLLGAAALFRRIPRWATVVITAACAAWTMSIFFAALGGMNLSTYFTPSELLRFQAAALRTAARFFQPLEGVPPQARWLVFEIVALCLGGWALAAALGSRLKSASITAVCAAAVAAASIVFLAAGLDDRGHLPEFRALIEHNRPYQRLPGGPDVRTGLLRDEADYLRKSGREAEAQRTEREMMALVRARQAAAAKLGIEER